MTGFLHEKEFSRKSFVKGGGALIVGLTLPGVAKATNYPKEASPMHTGLNPGPLDLNQVDSFIAIHSDNTASVQMAMNGHLCRCGTYPRILTAIKQAAAVMAKGGK